MDDAWLNTVRIARDCGNVSSLFPPGVTSALDLPYTLFESIRLALYFLKFEEIPEPKDRPPKHIWLDAEKLTQWGKEIAQAQKERMEGGAIRDMPENKAVHDVFPGMSARG